MTIKNSLRSYTTLILINSLIAILISSRYLITSEFHWDWLSTPFVISSIMSHIPLLWCLFSIAFIPVLLLLHLSHPLIQKVITAFYISTGLMLLLIDTFIFEFYRFHFNIGVFKFLWFGQAIELSTQMISILIISFIAILIFEFFLLDRILKKDQQKIPYKKSALSIFVICLITSHFSHAYAAAQGISQILLFKKQLPLFYPLTANKLLNKYDLYKPQFSDNNKVTFKGELNYPLNPLEYKSTQSPPNIVMIVIDTWRYDTLTPKTTPNIYQFIQENDGIMLHNHYSTSHSTRGGLFGLFYGINGSYFNDILMMKKAPEFIKRLQDIDYQTKILASAQLIFPEFNRTIFRTIKNLQTSTQGNNALERDKQITEQWQRWFQQKDEQKSHFSFLFYDGLHAYAYPKDYPVSFGDMASSPRPINLNNDYEPHLIFNRYKKSLHYVDSLIGKVLTTLKNKGSLENTLVIITSDHGEEMNDNHKNYWGHGSNFSSAQTKVPLALIGNKIKSDFPIVNLKKRTSHYDLTPSLLKKYFGLQSPITHFSHGKDLFNLALESNRWLFMGSRNVITFSHSDFIIHTESHGYFSATNDQMKTLEDKDIPWAMIPSLTKELNRFYFSQ